jgi:dUTP pyrophosphatase
MNDEIIIPSLLTDPEASLPEKAHYDDGAADLRSVRRMVIFPGNRALVPTGLSLALPEGYAALVLPRSGLALKHGITVLNSPGLVDAGYRGEIGIILQNHGSEAFDIAVGDRIAQLMVISLTNWKLQEVPLLPESVRGAGGFGSSGKG